MRISILIRKIFHRYLDLMLQFNAFDKQNRKKYSSKIYDNFVNTMIFFNNSDKARWKNY